MRTRFPAAAERHLPCLRRVHAAGRTRVQVGLQIFWTVSDGRTGNFDKHGTNLQESEATYACYRQPDDAGVVAADPDLLRQAQLRIDVVKERALGVPVRIGRPAVVRDVRGHLYSLRVSVAPPPRAAAASSRKKTDQPESPIGRFANIPRCGPPAKRVVSVRQFPQSEPYFEPPSKKTNRPPSS